ncbi:Protein TIC 21 [Hibiscus syriacus]|uniref:Protein TIC 21 n=1 Tax=Hibiscus syriacus TaxID=106335 RepID=A0A6A2ZJ26_HIBSY|nr:Protein TIC 21 [Hibiscus syriacus]
MQTLLLPATRSVICATAMGPLLLHRHRPPLTLSPPEFLTSIKTRKLNPLMSPFASYDPLNVKASSSSVSPSSTSFNDDAVKEKLAQAAKRLEITLRYFKRLGNLGFWAQLTVSMHFASGIVAAFISVFWSFGYIRLSEKLKKTANDPSKAPPRADVVKSLKNGIVLNLLGMGAAILGMQATVGFLVAKALTSSTNPYYQGISPGYSPALALDVFLVQVLVLIRAFYWIISNF